MRTPGLIPGLIVLLALGGCREIAQEKVADGYDLDGDNPGQHQPSFDISNTDADDDEGGAEFDESAAPPDEDPPDGGETIDGPAAELTIDSSVHSWTDANGEVHSGVWGEPFTFRMADYPVTWAIALVHASMLLRSRGIDLSPNAVLSVAIKESRLGCREPTFPNNDGCFQIEETTAYTELQRLFPSRFAAPHSTVISGGHFETSALALVTFNLLSEGMFRLHTADPGPFFSNHPDGPRAHQMVLSAAYNRGWWWTGLADIFANCGGQVVTDCYESNFVAIDHSRAIADYTAGLAGAPGFDTDLTLEELLAYWETIRPLYPDVSQATVVEALIAAFANAGAGSPTISFSRDLRAVLDGLIATLPPLPTTEESIDVLCGIGYLSASPPC